MRPAEPQAILTPITEAAIFLVADRRSRRRGRRPRPARGRQRAQALGRLPHPRGRADLRGRHRRCGSGTGCSARRGRPGCTRSARWPARGTAPPATPGDLFFHLRAHRLDLCFELAQRLIDRLAGHARRSSTRCTDSGPSTSATCSASSTAPRTRRARPRRGGADRRRGPAVRRRELCRRQKYVHDLAGVGRAARRGAGARDRPDEADDIELPDDVQARRTRTSR